MKEVQYLALGDSYTIGEAVTPALSFPYQLAGRFDPEIRVQPLIIARTGWTTGELIQAIQEQNIRGPFDLVTLLIGVNNQYRGYPLEEYQREFASLLEQALGFAGQNKDRVFVISIPDWGVTPFAAGDKRSRTQIAEEIASFNKVNQEAAERAGVAYVSITEGSRKAVTDPLLIAEDGLHPSAKMYSQWVDALWPLVSTVL